MEPLVPQGLPAELKALSAQGIRGDLDLAAWSRLLRRLNAAGSFAWAAELSTWALSHRGLDAHLGCILESAVALFGSGRIDEAKALARALQTSYPQNCHAYRLEAKILAFQGRYKDAVATLTRCPTDDSNENVNTSTIYSAVSLKIYIASQNFLISFARPKSSLPPSERAAIVMMARDEDDILMENLTHHYALGFRFFVIMLNCCRDETESQLNQFKTDYTDATVVTIVDPVEAYYQSRKTQAAYEFGSAYFSAIGVRIDWWFILDADEFITLPPGVPMAEILLVAEERGASVVAFHLCNSTNNQGLEFRSGMDVYSTMNVMVKTPVPVVTKNAFSSKIKPTIRMGNHELTCDRLKVDDILIAAEFGAVFVHLPYRSVDQTLKKIVNGGSALEKSNFQRDIGGHWRVLYDQFKSRGAIVAKEQFALYVSSTINQASTVYKFSFTF